MEELPAAKKKKKSKHLELYSALNGKGPSAPVPVLSQVRSLHSNAARWNEALAPKTFLVKKKKKKGLSILKKKILLERLRVHIKKKLESSLAGRTGAAVISQGGEHTIRVYNFADDVDLNDEDETKEVCSDLQNLLLPAGPIRRIRILADRTQDAPNRNAYVEVAFCSEQSARAAADSINGLVCGGRPVVAAVGDAATSLALSPNQTELPKGEPSMPDNSTEASTGRISIYNMVSEESVGDPDEVQEILSDAMEICAAYGRVQRVALHSVSRSTERRIVMQSDDTAMMEEEHEGEGAAVSGLPWACVQFSSVQAASASVTALNGRVVGGSEISAQLYDYAAYQAGDYVDRHLCSTAGEDSRSTAVRLRGFATAEEVQDEDERAELLNNISALVHEGGNDGEFGNAWFVLQNQADRAGDGNDEPAGDPAADVIMPVSSLQQAATNRENLSTQRVAGSLLCADIITIEVEAAGAQSGLDVLRYSETGNQIVSGAGNMVGRVSCLCSHTGAAVVVVKNFFTEEDIEEGEDLAQAKADLLELCAEALESVGGGVVRVHSVRGSHLATVEDGAAVGSAAADVVLVVTFASSECALQAMLHLDERVVGGDALRVVMEDTSAYQAEVLVSQEYPAGGEGTRQEAASSGEQRVADPEPASHGEFECIYEEEFAVPEVATADSAGHQLGDATEDGQEDLAGGRGPGSSKYVQASALPKLSRHDQPNLPIPVADEATNAAAKELLRLISTFQARMKEKNPQKAKQKLRFVAGMKQCTNSIKAGKVRVLLLAPNTEANEAVDDKIDSLIEEARQREVPVCYCLSKRILGKAVQLSMKQSAIAVLDPDGAYEYFKIIVKFINPRA